MQNHSLLNNASYHSTSSDNKSLFLFKKNTVSTQVANMPRKSQRKDESEEEEEEIELESDDLEESEEQEEEEVVPPPKKVTKKVPPKKTLSKKTLSKKASPKKVQVKKIPPVVKSGKTSAKAVVKRKNTPVKNNQDDNYVDDDDVDDAEEQKDAPVVKSEKVKKTFVIVVDKIIPKVKSPKVTYKDLRRKAVNTVVIKDTYGSYRGFAPKQAAKKAISAIAKAARVIEPDNEYLVYIFTIKETTGTRNKNLDNEHTFVGFSRLLPGGPKTITKETTSYEVKHEPKVIDYDSSKKYDFSKWPVIGKT